MSVIKKPYEISIWEDVIVYVGVDQNGQSIESLNLADLASVEYLYYTELRLAIIGSNTMTSPARAINPTYKKNINGIETLTFDMYYQYEEVESGEIIRNPLINLVLDERKVKLWYENDWHDFIVKKDDEKGRDYKYSFTCTGLAANELGKTGFNIELDTELENNMGTVQELAAAVLEGSDWLLAEEGQEVIQLTNDEALYKILLGKDISPKKLDGSNYGTISTGSCIYAYYTPYANEEENYFLFIYVDKENGFGIPDLYEDDITIYCTNTAGGTYDLYMSGITWYNGYPDFCFTEVAVTETLFNANKTRYWYSDGLNGYVQCTSDSVYDSDTQYYITAVTVADYRGRRHVRKLLSNYDPVLERPVLEYTRDGTTYYGYTTTKYIDSTTILNYIYNSVNFAGTSYWGIYGNSNNKSISAQVFPSVSSNNTSLTRAGYLVVNFGNSTATKLVNEGIILNYSRIDKFEKGDKFRFRLYAGTVSEDIFTAFTTSTLPINCKVKKYETIDVDSANDIIYFNSADSSTVISADSSGYICVDMVCLESATWRELKENVGIFFSLNNASETNYYIKDILFYRYLIGKNNCVVAPDDPIENLPDVRIETVYHFYDPSINIGKFSEEDYVFSESDPSLYTPLYGSGENEFEKTRSITAKESNRFNLLQELSETFECWVKFKVEHESNGTIKVEDFDYYDIVSNSDPEQLSNYYIYDWLNKQYILPTEYDENAQYYTKVTRKRQVKKVSFYKEILIDNYAGFKYGINLNANNRTLDSEQIVTKIIVKNNSCDLAENGFCSIARAQDNPIKENFVYNFDYYTSQGLINLSTLNNDLYLEVNGSIGLYPRLSRLNKERNALIDSSAPLANSINDLTSKYLVATLMYNEAEKDLQRMKDPQSGTIYLYTHYVYEDFYNLYGRIGTSEVVNVNVPSYPNEIYYISVEGLSNITTNDNSNLIFYLLTTDTSPQPGTTYYYMSSGKFVLLYATSFRTTTHYYIKLNSASYAAETYFQTSGTTSTLTFTGSGSPEVYVYNAARRRMLLGAEDYIDDNFTISTLEKIATQEANKALAQAEMEEYGTDLENTLALYDAIESQLKEIANATDEVEKEFNVKYARYILEGSWMDDNYMDDDLYYLDSLGVLYLSAYPKVSYNFTVLDLSLLNGYEAYKFDIGHKTFVEDKEFFGYKIVDGLKTPVREQVVVTEANINLDEPDKNSLKVQNYKSHFEDLFQRITAATQNVEYHSGEYGRAASAITSTGEVSESVMLRSLATSNYVIQNSHDLSVTWDETGILAINLSDPAQVTRLASAGLLVSSDGGLTWGVAISGYGINTNYLSAGIIDADNINIMSGAFPTFRWDSAGLRAYGFNLDANGNVASYDPSKYVNYDKFGIYGVNGLTEVDFNSIDDVEDKASYALTWNGLFIRSLHRDGFVRISPTEDVVLYETRLVVEDNETTTKDFLRGKFGLLSDDGTTEIYGLALYAADGLTNTVTTLSDGTLWLLDSMKIGKVGESNTIYIGVGEDEYEDGEPTGRYKIFKVTDPADEEENFVVYSDGTVIAKAALIDGSINATSGTIGGAVISDNGITVKDGFFEIYTVNEEFTEVPDLTEEQFNENKSLYWYKENDQYQLCTDESVFNSELLYYTKSSTDEKVFYVENGELLVKGTIYADNGEFTGTIHATDGEFTGEINALSGAIGGFTITQTSILSGEDLRLFAGDENTESSIWVKNLHIGNGAKIEEYIDIGNLRLLNPSSSYDNLTVLRLVLPHDLVTTDLAPIANKNYYTYDSTSEEYSLFTGNSFELGTAYYEDGIYFSLNEAGDITGNNWSIKKETGNDYVTARFGKLIAEDGEFNGTIHATDGYFEGEITSSVINAVTINAASFITLKVRAMGGSFIFKPTFNITNIENVSDNTTYGIVEVTIPENARDYFLVDLITGIDVVVGFTGNDTRYGVLTDTSNAANGKIKVKLLSTDYNTLLSQADKYQTIILLGAGNNTDSLIGINSDNVGSILPPRALIIESFSNLQGTGSGTLSYAPKLLLGDLSTLNISGLSGYGLYGDNVYLNGSLITKNGLNSTYAGINTLQNINFSYSNWGGTNTDTYTNDKIVFWGGSVGLNADAILRSPFIVTDKGNIFAALGEFKGSVISDSVITQSIIKTPIIYGTGNSPSLKIYDTNKTDTKTGIGFYKLVGNIDNESNETNDVLTLVINNTGFYHYYNNTENKFISFGESNNNIEITANSYKVENTSITSLQIVDTVDDVAAQVDVLGGNNGMVRIDYAGYGVKAESGSVTNYGGQVINKGNMLILHEGSPDLYLNYKYVNGYYCLYVS